MSKKLYFLISFVLVLSLGGLAQAGTPIVVDNNSFEYDCNGFEVTCHTGHDVTPGEQCDGGIAAWRYLLGFGSSGWTGIDVNCGTEDVNCTNCKDWLEYDDGNAHLFFQGSTSVHQILDHNIVYGQKYTATVNLLGWDPIVIQFFALDDVCYPDANHLEISTTVIDTTSYVDTEGSGRNVWMLDQVAIGVVADMAMVGKKLGIKIGGDHLIGGTDTSYLWADYVRVEYEWASNAYDPSPTDGAGDVNSQALTLSWMPGLWAVSDVNGHEVYFGTSWADVEDANTANTALYPNVYRGTGVGVVSGPDGNNRYSYVIPGGDLPFPLGESYFWRIDEVNGNYVGPIPTPWKGDVWSFEVEGKAKAVYPADGAEDIPALNLILRWEAGVGAGSHDVYFGTSKTDVEDANTSNTAMYPNVFRVNQLDVNDPNYSVPEGLDVGEPHFWRIDEVNTVGPTFVRGDVWSFTTGMFLLVDSFEPYRYVTTTDLTNVWKDPLNETLNNAQLTLFFDDINMIYAGDQSMEFAYRCFEKSGADWIGSWAAADMPTEVGTDWTVAGAKALVVYFYGDPCNAETGRYTGQYDISNDQMYVELEDLSANTGIVRLPNMSDVKEASWHTWNISLQDPCFSSVDMNNVAKIYIGFGGEKGGQGGLGAGYKSGKYDSIWFDDIRLYPPRCMPSTTGIDVLSGLGDITGGGEEGVPDCNTDYFDLDIMARDWASIDGQGWTENRPAVFTAGEPNWVTGHIGSGAIEGGDGDEILVTDPRLLGLTSMTISAWVKRDGDQDQYVGIVTSRELRGDPSFEDATELSGGSTGESVGYGWNQIQKTWQHSSGLVVEDANWTFIAMSVDPTGCSLYAKDANEAMQTPDRHDIELGPLKQFQTQFWIGQGRDTSRYYRGSIDDVRIYGYNLDDANIGLLANKTGEPNPPPVYWWKFDDGSGLSAADSGTPIEVYTGNMSLANLVPKDPCDSEDPNLAEFAFDPNNLDIINFLDYRIMAEHWLEKHQWP